MIVKPHKWWRILYSQDRVCTQTFSCSYFKCLPHTLSNSSLPSPQSLSLSHFHRSEMHCPFRHVKKPASHLVPLSTMQCLLLLAKYQRPSDGHWHSAPSGPKFMLDSLKNKKKKKHRCFRLGSVKLFTDVILENAMQWNPHNSCKIYLLRKKRGYLARFLFQLTKGKSIETQKSYFRTP